MMGHRQIALLKLLGYEDSQEEGALLEHPDLLPAAKFVWKDDQFDWVLGRHTYSVIRAERCRIKSNIDRMKYDD